MNRLSVQPVGNRLIVKPDPKKEVSEGGLYIPDSAISHITLVSGRILAVSKDLPELSVGMKIVFSDAAGKEDEIDGIKVKWLQHTCGQNSEVWGIDEGGDLKAL